MHIRRLRLMFRSLGRSHHHGSQHRFGHAKSSRSFCHPDQVLWTAVGRLELHLDSAAIVGLWAVLLALYTDTGSVGQFAVSLPHLMDVNSDNAAREDSESTVRPGSTQAPQRARSQRRSGRVSPGPSPEPPEPTPPYNYIYAR